MLRFALTLNPSPPGEGVNGSVLRGGGEWSCAFLCYGSPSPLIPRRNSISTETSSAATGEGDVPNSMEGLLQEGDAVEAAEGAGDGVGGGGGGTGGGNGGEKRRPVGAEKLVFVFELVRVAGDGIPGDGGHVARELDGQDRGQRGGRDDGDGELVGGAEGGDAVIGGDG